MLDFNITSILPVSDINIEYGSSLTLPATIKVTLSGGIDANPEVVWDSGVPTFDANTSGTYVFSGTITTISGINNSDNLKATVNVVVAQKPIPEEQLVPENQESTTESSNPADILSDLIQQSVSGLLNNTWQFANWIFSSGLNKILSIDISNKLK